MTLKQPLTLEPFGVEESSSQDFQAGRAEAAQYGVFVSVPDLPGGMGLAIANNETRLAQFAMLAEKPFQLSHMGV